MIVKVVGPRDVSGPPDAMKPERSGGAIPPPILAVRGTLERARVALGSAADALYEEGREISLIRAASIARGAITGQE